MAPDIKHGKEFEKEIHDAFRDLYKTLPILWERVVDTHDAGNVIRQADCDFKLTINSGIQGKPNLIFVECKASNRFRSLADNGARRSLIKGEQIAKMRLALRAGTAGIFLFKDASNKRVQAWEASEVIEAWGKKRVAWDGRPMDEFHLKYLNDWAYSFVSQYLEHL